MTLLRGYFSPQLLRSGICSWDVLEILKSYSTLRLLLQFLSLLGRIKALL